MRDRKIRTVITSALLAVVLLLSFLGVAIAADPTADASRTIDPKVVGPGEEVEITVEFTSLLGEPKAFALLEDIPAGWNFTRGTDDASAFKAGPPPEWVWFIVGAGATKTVTYTLTVPVDAESGNYTIDGTVTGASVENPVGGDTTITVMTALYDLTMAADPGTGGTATDLTNASPYAEGAEVSIKAEAAEGYEFVNWTAPAGGFDDANAPETTFTMPAQNVTVTAHFGLVSPPVYPTVTTQAATNITTDSATFNMNYTTGDFSPVQVSFAYKKSTDSTWSYTAWVSKSGSGTYSEPRTGLDSDTTYYFKSQLKYDDTTIEGTTLQFTTAKLPVTSGCFIATAAYGTPTAEKIDVLREFRDDVLLKNTVGSRLVDFYYRTSPTIADFISKHDVVRTLVRELVVDPIVQVVEATGDIWRNLGNLEFLVNPIVGVIDAAEGIWQNLGNLW